jgi:hypothetical protein
MMNCMGMSGVVAGVIPIALSLPRGPSSRERYGGRDRPIV